VQSPPEQQNPNYDPSTSHHSNTDTLTTPAATRQKRSTNQDHQQRPESVPEPVFRRRRHLSVRVAVSDAGASWPIEGRAEHAIQAAPLMRNLAMTT